MYASMKTVAVQRTSVQGLQRPTRGTQPRRHNAVIKSVAEADRDVVTPRQTVRWTTLCFLCRIVFTVKTVIDTPCAYPRAEWVACSNLTYFY
jgi:hypothetical protein